MIKGHRQGGGTEADHGQHHPWLQGVGSVIEPQVVGPGQIKGAAERTGGIQRKRPRLQHDTSRAVEGNWTIDHRGGPLPAFNEGPGVVDPVVRTAVELREVPFPLHDPRAPGRVFNPGRKIAGIPPKEEARSSVVGRAPVFEDTINELPAAGRQVRDRSRSDNQPAVPGNCPRRPLKGSGHLHH